MKTLTLSLDEINHIEEEFSELSNKHYLGVASKSKPKNRERLLLKSIQRTRNPIPIFFIKAMSSPIYREIDNFNKSLQALNSVSGTLITTKRDLCERVSLLLTSYQKSKNFKKKYPNLSLPSLDLYASTSIQKGQKSLLEDLSSAGLGDIYAGSYGRLMGEKLALPFLPEPDYGYILFREDAIFEVIDSYESTLDSLEILDLLFVLLLCSKLDLTCPTFLKVPFGFYNLVDSLSLAHDLPRSYSRLYPNEPNISVQEVMAILEHDPDSLFSSLDYCINFLQVFSI